MPSTTRSTRHGAVGLLVMAAVAGIAACGGGATEPDAEDRCSVPDKTFAAIRVQPSAFTLRVGYTVPIQATPVDAQGLAVVCAPPITWSSTDRSVAITANGYVFGAGAGTVFIRATAGDKSDSAKVTVVVPPIATVTIFLAPASLLVGQTVRLVLGVRDDEGNPLTPRSIAWRTDDASVATISTQGMLVAAREGMTTVTAEAEGITATVRIPITRDAPVVRFHQIASGSRHTCALADGGRFPKGAAFCWGDGTSGQLGSIATGYSPVPSWVFLPLQPFTFIAAGGNSSCALIASGEAYCWGSNEVGQLGDGTTVNRTEPVRVVTPLAFRSLALGGTITCGLTYDDVAYCWGHVEGTNVLTPAPVPGGIRFAELTSGGSGFVCGRTREGRAYCWGTTDYTWAGPTPTAVKGDLLFSQISAGLFHVCGVAISNGLGYCWGQLDLQPLGPSVPAGSRDTPVAVPGGLRFTSIAVGVSFTCGVTASGSYCLGQTYLSNGGGAAPSPIPMEDRHRFTTISGGALHACAIDVNGGAWCWGRNFEGQVGAGESGLVTSPLQIRME